LSNRIDNWNAFDHGFLNLGVNIDLAKTIQHRLCPTDAEFKGKINNREKVVTLCSNLIDGEEDYFKQMDFFVCVCSNNQDYKALRSLQKWQ